MEKTISERLRGIAGGVLPEDSVLLRQIAELLERELIWDVEDLGDCLMMAEEYENMNVDKEDC